MFCPLIEILIAINCIFTESEDHNSPAFKYQYKTCSKGHSTAPTTEETEPDPVELIDVTTEYHNQYPTDRDKIYPSNRDGAYGFVVQSSSGSQPHFTRPRGKEVYYFEKIGKSFKFTSEMVAIKNNRKKLPPDITSIFKGPEGLYYFIREDAYCRRPLNVSGVGLDPPDYCPEGGDLRELLGCNIRFYPPEVDDLCNNPLLDHSLLAPDGKTAWLIRGKDVWLLHNLPTNPKASPSKCNMTKGTDVTKRWKNFNLRSDALFLIENEGKGVQELVQFHRHKFIVWNWKGGQPLYEGFIKEMPIDHSHYKNKNRFFTEKPIEAPVETNSKTTIVYKEVHFKELCKNPTIDSADSNLDGTVVYLFKDDNYYILEGVKERGIGKLVKFGKTADVFERFFNKSAAVMTTKEGKQRGHTYEYYLQKSYKPGVVNLGFTSWDINKKVYYFERQSMEIEASQLVGGEEGAAFHNRNITDPVMIVLKDDDVFYFSTVGDIFVRKRRQLKYYESAEKLPSGVIAAFSMPNQILYLFKDKHYCVRPLFYNSIPPYCPEWLDSRELFGCFGDIPVTTTPAPKLPKDVKAMKNLCSDLNIDDADRSWQRTHRIYIWRKDMFWLIDDFPDNPRVIRSGLSAKEWEMFSENPDAVSIIQEGQLRRGWVYAMFGGYWSSWYPDNKPWVGYKSWWGQPTDSKKFGAMIHNGDIKNPLVIGFDGIQVHMYSSEGTILEHRSSKNVAETEELWPKDVTAAFRMMDNTVYLFRKDRYCKRSWKCADKETNCCKEWIDAKVLFNCESLDTESGDDTESTTEGNPDYEITSQMESEMSTEEKREESTENNEEIESTPKYIPKPSDIRPTPKTLDDESDENTTTTPKKKRKRRRKVVTEIETEETAV